MKKVYTSVEELIGNTPLLELVHLEEEYQTKAKIYAKLEYLNATGSVKDRIAREMILDAEERGVLQKGATIIEPTSGNTGIGLAAVGTARGYRVIIVMPETFSIERRKLIKAYGAEIVLSEGSKGMPGAIAKANELAEEIPGSFIPAQFDNPANPEIQKSQTAQEILEQVEGPIDGFCSGVGTGGTITGIGEALREKNPDMVIWAAEPENAAILAGGNVGTHLQMGIGDGVIPPILNQEVYDHIHIVTDEDAIETAKDLARLEGLMCGISSGTNVSCAIELAKKLGPGKTVVTVLPDTAERYFSTPLFED